jgi:LysM repeat protein
MEYIVKSGDCLSVIAERELGSVVHLDRLREVNGLSSDSLRLGQRLILPHIGETAPVRGTDLKRDPLPSQSSEDSKEWKWVEVREGDSLWKIAARELGAGHRHDEITGWNQLNSDILRPGTQLRVQRSAATELAMGGEGR